MVVVVDFVFEVTPLWYFFDLAVVVLVTEYHCLVDPSLKVG